MSTKATAWYRVTVSAYGVKSVERVSSAAENCSRVYYVQATTKSEAAVAGKVAFNAYCAARVRQRRAALAEKGLCNCGRTRDTKRFTLCAVCRERQRDHRRRNPGKGAVTGRPRDEAARVAANKVRQRDRRKEIRLETLLAVREAHGRPRFTEWLDREIKNAVAPTLVDVSTKRGAA